MDIIIKDFLERNNIDANKLKELPECRIYSVGEKNAIAKQRGIFSSSKFCDVSVGDIIGYDWEWNNNSNDLIDDMSNFFRGNDDSYHTRSNGMLDYTSDNILQGLEGSFNFEPIILRGVDNNYFVSENGLHRFHILRLHYLNELSNATSDEDRKKIKEKYKIKAKVRNLDYIKTYCSFLLSIISKSYSVYNEFNDNYDITGKAEVIINGHGMIMSDEELINFVKSKFIERNFSGIEKVNLNYALQLFCDTIPSFNTFMNEYFSTLNIGRSK